MRVLLENTTFLLHKELRVLLELRVLFEGGPYMRKYGYFLMKTLDYLFQLYLSIKLGFLLVIVKCWDCLVIPDSVLDIFEIQVVF